MRIRNVHDRVVAAAPQRIARLIGDFAAIWPDDIAPAPRQLAYGVYAVGPMVWEEMPRAGAARAFRVTHPLELEAEHWFEIRLLLTGTLVRHVVSGEAHFDFADIWRVQLEPVHDLILEALLDRIAAKSIPSEAPACALSGPFTPRIAAHQHPAGGSAAISRASQPRENEGYSRGGGDRGSP